MHNMKPVQYAQDSYFAHFWRLFFFQFRDKRIFSSFYFYLFIFLFFLGEGVAVEMGERTKAHWDKSPLGQKPTGQYPTGQKPTA